MREPLWLETDDVIAINQDIVAQTSEPHFLREPNLLESALARPINLFLYGEEADLVVLAARLMEGIRTQSCV